MNSLIEKLKNNKILSIVIFFIYPVLIFYLNRLTMFDHFLETELKPALANIIFYEILLFLLFFILNRASLALKTELVLMWILGIANAYIYRFRHSYIRPWDIGSFGTAMNVAGNYDYTPESRMIISFVVMVLLFILAGLCALRADAVFKKGAAVRAAGALVCVLLICSMTFLVQRNTVKDIIGIYTTQFDSKGMMKKNSMVLSFMYQMKFLKVEKPEGYSAKDEAETVASFSVDSTVPEKMPDIMVFMDEAFSDPAVDGEFSTDTDYMPFIHSLQEGSENTITGYINTSVNGGNTPNTEFEFLTGNTMAFLPDGSIAFQQYVHREMDSIPSYLKSLGYQTFASHPYKASGWDRTRVWPLLGFEECYFDDYFDSLDLPHVRKYVSDEAHFDTVSDMMDEKSAASPVFSFNVTMQNHSGYSNSDFDNFEQLVKLKDADENDENVKRMNNYLSLVRYTDDALKKTIERYSKEERPVMIVFFGDHQPDPSTLDVMWNQNGKNRDSLSDEDYANTYRVPFVIWANFDIDEMTGIETSVNYLGNLVLEEAGFSLPSYRAFLSDYEKDYPVVSAVRYVDKDGSQVLKDRWGDELLDYQRMQYYEMFDDKDSLY